MKDLTFKGVSTWLAYVVGFYGAVAGLTALGCALIPV